MTDFQKEQLSKLKDNSQQELIYSVLSNSFGDMDCFGYFTEYDNAYSLGKTLDAPFNIQVSYISDTPGNKGLPEPLNDPKQKYTPNNSVATIRFDAQGNTITIIFDK